MPELNLPKVVVSPPPPSTPPAPTRRNRSLLWVLGILGAIVLTFVALLSYYSWSLTPKDPSATGEIRLIVAPGDSVSVIANNLYDADLIRDATVFRIYAELTDTKDQLQAGGYALSKNMSVADIIDHMSTGQTDELTVQIVPGLTLKQQSNPDINRSLAQQGFSPSEIESAFDANYDHPLLALKPADQSLEGYIYPDTYRIAADSGVPALLTRSFDEFYRVIQENDIEARLKARNMNFHQGITLASIIQKEASNEQDQKQIAQVFYSRLASDIELGSDVTFLYAAELLGVKPTIGLDSPYNTRVKKGLPPGPIANFNLSALTAVVSPAEGDFLYFVSDKEGVTHFARTLEEHEANVERYNRESRDEFSF